MRSWGELEEIPLIKGKKGGSLLKDVEQFIV
jgi:hypothetical protein